MDTMMEFKNKAFRVIRTVLLNGEPYFIGKDVAEALGYSNSSKAVGVHVDTEDKHFIFTNLRDAQNGNLENLRSKITVINESGLYSLILSSKLPTAKAFKRWVTSEILPSIRKTGSYHMEREMEERELLARGLYAAQNIITELRPKAEYGELMLSSRMLIGEFGELLKKNGYNTGSRKLHAWLRSNGYLISQGKQYNLPTTWALELGLFETEKTVIAVNGTPRESHRAYITGKGQQYIAEVLRMPTVGQPNPKPKTGGQISDGTRKYL